MVRRNRVVELFESLASAQLTIGEFIRLAELFSEEELRHLRNILRGLA